jgi:hypothetical protein
LAVAAVVALGTLASPVSAIHKGGGKKRISSVSRSDSGATHLARVIFEGNGPARAQGEALPLRGGPQQVATTHGSA